MKLTKDHFIHNRITFDATEKNVLTVARKIIEDIRTANIHGSGTEDEYLTEKCDDIVNGIAELLNDYTNQYLEQQE